MPPIDDRGRTLVNHLMDIGPVDEWGGPVKWREIRAWRLETGHMISGPEAEEIRRMSATYAMASRSSIENVPAPYTSATREEIAEQLKQGLRALKRG